jgi:hypothetical protein
MRRAALGLTALGCAAAALSGCGAGGGAATARSPHPEGYEVRLNLRGESGDKRMLACESVHDYAQFRAGRPIKYDGTVRPMPARRWKVKVKIKRCVDGRFQDSGADRVPGVSGGRFAGKIQPPGKGVYFARARYRDAKGDVVSDKEFFQVR